MNIVVVYYLTVKDTKTERMTRKTGHNSTYKKLAVQWLNEALCFVSSSVLADSLVLRNRQLLVDAKRYAASLKNHNPQNISNLREYVYEVIAYYFHLRIS